MSDVTTAQVHHHAHHFNSAEEEFEASKQGMWLFMVTEVLMIGGLFVAYGIFRGLYPELFSAAHTLLNVKLGATNTVVLIVSSLTMVLAVSATQRGQRDRAILFLVFTFILACCFLVVKYFEYTHKIHDGLLPGGNFTFNFKEYAAQWQAALPGRTAVPEFHIPKAGLFFSLYFMMTGIHAAHVIIGMGLIAWLIKRSAAKEFSPAFYTPVELVGFYWHFVDLVWIYLFPLLYLVG